MRRGGFCEAEARSGQKTARIGDGGGVPRSVQHPHNQDLIFRGKIIDGIAAMESHSQPSGELASVGAR